MGGAVAFAGQILTYLTFRPESDGTQVTPYGAKDHGRRIPLLNGRLRPLAKLVPQLGP